MKLILENTRKRCIMLMYTYLKIHQNNLQQD